MCSEIIKYSGGVIAGMSSNKPITDCANGAWSTHKATARRIRFRQGYHALVGPGLESCRDTVSLSERMNHGSIAKPLP